MSLAADLGAAELTVLLDLRHPLAYLALGPATAFGKDQGISMDWLPLEVPALNAPSPPGPDDDRGSRHRRYRAEALAREISTYAEAQGLELRRDYYAPVDASAAHLAWLWVRHRAPERLPEFLAELFRSYWTAALDPASVAEATPLVEAAGLDAAGWRDLAEGEGPAAAAAFAEELGARGLFQVPAFLVEDEVFYGRQHLPMIRWILEGRVGPGPI